MNGQESIQEEWAQARFANTAIPKKKMPDHIYLPPPEHAIKEGGEKTPPTRSFKQGLAGLREAHKKLDWNDW